MLILFPKRKGVKIATTIIFEEMAEPHNPLFVLGMIYFAAKFGAITPAEQSALIQLYAEQNRKE